MENRQQLSIEKCRECEKHLPFPPNPIFQWRPNSKICIIGQAPGLVAHNTGKPWNDNSGERLRTWLGLTPQQFYDPQNVSIIPMGFCYPGKAKSGDKPPRPECAPRWHTTLLDGMNVELTILIGKHAQDYYLPDKMPLTDRVKNWASYGDKYIILPHPSGRNNIWLAKNPWFEKNILPLIKSKVKGVVDSPCSSR